MKTNPTAAPKMRPNSEFARPPYPPRMLHWLDLCERHKYLWVTSCNDLRESTPPQPMPSADFLHLVGALLCSHQADVLKELLKELLRDDIIELIQWYGGDQQ